MSVDFFNHRGAEPQRENECNCLTRFACTLHAERWKPILKNPVVPMGRQECLLSLTALPVPDPASAFRLKLWITSSAHILSISAIHVLDFSESQCFCGHFLASQFATAILDQHASFTGENLSSSAAVPLPLPRPPHRGRARPDTSGKHFPSGWRRRFPHFLQP
jgi:hypothetical protein